MDMKDLLNFVAQQAAENDPERAKPAMDFALSFTGPSGGGSSGSTAGGFGMRLDRRVEPPFVWAMVKKRRPLSLDPYVVEILEAWSDERPQADRANVRIVGEHVLVPRVEAYQLDAVVADEQFRIYAHVQPQRYGREVLAQWANQTILTPRSPRKTEAFEPWPGGNCGIALETEPKGIARVWAWLMPRALNSPYELRLVRVASSGVPTSEEVAAGTVIASVRLDYAPLTAGPLSVEATHEGILYSAELAFSESARNAARLLSDVVGDELS